MRFLLLASYVPPTERGGKETITTTGPIEEPAPDLTYTHWGWDKLQNLPIYAREGVASKRENVFDDHGNHIRTTEFESKMAILALNEYQLLNRSLVLVGRKLAVIVEEIIGTANLRNIAITAFTSALLNPNKYGTLRKENVALASKDIIGATMSLLTRGKAIPEIITAYFAVIRFIKNLPAGHSIKTRYCEIENNLCNDPLFERRLKDRGRIKDSKNKSISHEVGICGQNHPRFSSPRSTRHSRTCDVTVKDTANPTRFIVKAGKMDIPFVAGPSGSMLEILCCLKLIEEQCKLTLTQGQFKEFAFAFSAYSITASAHSFHEVMSVAQIHNVKFTYEPGQYLESIPYSILCSENFCNLCEEYSDLVSQPKKEPEVTIPGKRGFFGDTEPKKRRRYDASQVLGW